MTAWTRYDVTPVPKPRMTQRDRWAQRRCVVRYRGYKDMLRFLKVSLPLHAHVVFQMPMPKSWKDTRRNGLRGMDHHQKPDIDNLHKGLLDALFGEDCHIWDARITKIWGDTGAIFVREIEPPELPKQEESCPPIT